VTEIGDGAFKNRTDIRKLIIPATVVKVGNEAFAGCTNLVEVEAEDGEKLLDCGTDAFKDAPIALLYLGRDTSGLPFTGKDSLTDLTFGDKVTVIDPADFKGCTAIRNITVYAPVPPEVYEESFEDNVYENATLRVPDESVEDYKADEVWSKFFNLLGVSEIRPIDIEMELADVELTEGESTTLKAIITPENATDKTVTWSSSNEAVATVSATGVVTGIKAGTATITASTANGLTATCTVTVKEKPAGIGGVEGESQDAVRVEGDKLIAPEGSAIYDLNGRRVNANGLRPGIYIVRMFNGKSMKVMVK
ncbi:MAG: Ig-like domain-containing protein, partial [Paramuribaculum sp.]|nr:Ig-like domain-containing protein [Paramuribaculum sp.]